MSIEDMNLSKAYISGKLSCLDRDIKVAEQYLHTLKHEKRNLLLTLEDRTKLSKVRIRKVRKQSTVDIVINVSSEDEGEYIETDIKNDIKLIPFKPNLPIPPPIIEQLE